MEDRNYGSRVHVHSKPRRRPEDAVKRSRTSVLNRSRVCARMPSALPANVVCHLCVVCVTVAPQVHTRAHVFVCVSIMCVFDTGVVRTHVVCMCGCGEGGMGVRESLPTTFAF